MNHSYGILTTTRHCAVGFVHLISCKPHNSHTRSIIILSLSPLFLEQSRTLKLQRVSSVPQVPMQVPPCLALFCSMLEGTDPWRLHFLGFLANWSSQVGGWKVGGGEKLISSQLRVTTSAVAT